MAQEQIEKAEAAAKSPKPGRGSARVAEDGLIEVKLTAAHTHQGQPRQPGDSIRVRKEQINKLREWGVIK